MINIQNLTKKFGKFVAVNNVSFTVEPGESVALWGENGAGKTTIIRTILGLLSAKGNITVNGVDARKHGKKARAFIGYVPQELAFYDDLSAKNTLYFYARLKNIPTSRIAEVLADVGLSEHAKKAVSALSGGMKQRLALANALLANPPLLIFDEPTSNLDTAARDEFQKLLLAQRVAGKTMLFTSHRLEEVETLASRVVVLEAGNIKQICDQPTELAQQLGITMHLKLMVPQAMQNSALQLLNAQGFTASTNGVGVWVAVSPSAKMAPVRALLDENIEVSNFEIGSDYGN
ncbi:ABC transporter ATP-binding protein [Anaerolineales bacterium HSG25]|nr:ABC transporter ATP-binding protein [Anaerolineales bacterium HSG25]